MTPKKVFEKIQNRLITAALGNKAFRKRMFKKALANQLRNSKSGHQVLSNMNYLMSTNPAYHEEFHELAGKQNEYSKIFWASDLGYLWYLGNNSGKYKNAYFKLAVDRFREKKYVSHLDIGCGWGELSLLIEELQQADKLHAIDVSKEVIDAAIEKQGNSIIRFYVSDIEDINEKFDLVTLFGATDYIQPDYFLTFLRKMLHIAQKEILIVNSLRKVDLDEALKMTTAKKISRYDIGYVQPLNHLLGLLSREIPFTYSLRKISSDSILAQIVF